MPLQQRVAVTLWKLATNVEHRILVQLMGTGCSTACEIVNSVCEAITCHPTDEIQVQEIMDECEGKGAPPGNWGDRWLPCTNYLSKR